jgi:hypothetical protein
MYDCGTLRLGPGFHNGEDGATPQLAITVSQGGRNRNLTNLGMACESVDFHGYVESGSPTYITEARRDCCSHTFSSLYAVVTTIIQ